jgi:hypothetical protein
MRHILLYLTLSAGLVACDGDNSVRITTTSRDEQAVGVLKVIDSLQCPDSIGALTRKGLVAAGGASCVYGGPKGADVVLHLVKLGDRSVDDVLADFETQVSADLPRTTAKLAPSPPTPDADASSSSEPVETASVQAPGVDIQARGEDASVRLPGLRIETKGDNASVRIGGINIQAKDGQNTRTETASVSIDSSDQSTRVRTRAPGAATRMTYILSDDQPADAGWRTVGFEARGPSGGPIVIAVVRSKDRQNDSVFDDAKDLVALNVGR